MGSTLKNNSGGIQIRPLYFSTLGGASLVGLEILQDGHRLGSGQLLLYQKG